MENQNTPKAKEEIVSDAAKRSGDREMEGKDFESEIQSRVDRDLPQEGNDNEEVQRAKRLLMSAAAKQGTGKVEPNTFESEFQSEADRNYPKEQSRPVQSQGWTPGMESLGIRQKNRAE